jgi:hypothetical protein
LAEQNVLSARLSVSISVATVGLAAPDGRVLNEAWTSIDFDLVLAPLSDQGDSARTRWT